MWICSVGSPLNKCRLIECVQVHKKLCGIFGCKLDKYSWEIEEEIDRWAFSIAWNNETALCCSHLELLRISFLPSFLFPYPQCHDVHVRGVRGRVSVPGMASASHPPTQQQEYVHHFRDIKCIVCMPNEIKFQVRCTTLLTQLWQYILLFYVVVVVVFFFAHNNFIDLL